MIPAHEAPGTTRAGTLQSLLNQPALHTHWPLTQDACDDAHGDVVEQAHAAVVAGHGRLALGAGPLHSVLDTAVAAAAGLAHVTDRVMTAVAVEQVVGHADHAPTVHTCTELGHWCAIANIRRHTRSHTQTHIHTHTGGK